MAVVNIHGQPALDQRELTQLSAWFFGRSRLTSPKFWLTGIAFLALYLAFNKLTKWYQFDGLGITLWSPDNGLSLLLLTEGAVFAPFVFLGAVLTDVFITGVPHSLYVTVAAELVLAVGYVGLAAVLRHKLKFNPRRVRLADVVVLLTFVPAGTMLTSLSYCGVLYLGGALPADQFYAAMRHFWIGDTVGMITVIPAATSVFAFLSKGRWRWSGYELVSCSVFILGTCLGFVVLFGVGNAKEYHMFYLLFLPIIWAGMRVGYAGVAAALLAIQLGLIATTTYLGCEAKDFSVFQMLMLVLSITGLLLGAVITEREQAAQLLREQQTELARVSAYASAGAMGMAFAHEISQPLSTVAIYLHAARRMLQSGAASAPVMDALSMAETEARRTREVLERVRDFVSSGKLDLKPLDLSNLALKIGALCREEATARGIHVEIENIRPIPLVRADRIQIEQVLNNLVANAIDAASERTDARGLVVVRVARRGDRVIVQVEDNGPGVAPEMADRLFEAYQTTKPRGMGLGLPLSLQIVQKHAGRLWWEQIVPEGTRFLVELQINGPDNNAA
ncbi:MAG: ATP-binding protein [Pseudomonadota bacterium]|nr:ATP-binding protein [Pseudomonadota bacterium]